MAPVRAAGRHRQKVDHFLWTGAARPGLAGVLLLYAGIVESTILRASFLLAALAAMASTAAFARGGGRGAAGGTTVSSASARTVEGVGTSITSSTGTAATGFDKDFFKASPPSQGGGGPPSGYMAVETPLEQNKKFDNAGPRGFFGR